MTWQKTHPQTFYWFLSISFNLSFYHLAHEISRKHWLIFIVFLGLYFIILNTSKQVSDIGCIPELWRVGLKMENTYLC